MQELKENIIPKRSSVLKTGKALLQFSLNNVNNSNERFRSKSVTFNKAVMLNLMEESSEEEEEVCFEEECEIVVKFNMEKIYYLVTQSYL